MRTSTLLTAAFFATFAVAAPAVVTVQVTIDDSATGSGPFNFGKVFKVNALPDQVRNGTEAVPGAPEARGFFNYGINAETDTICYNITLLNVVGDYQSPAKTATHIHEAAVGQSGPPRIAFPDPVGDDTRRSTVGCMTGPFTTGLMGPDGQDTGTGFRVAQIEANPAGFFTDSHTALFPVGVVRGQLA